MKRYAMRLNIHLTTNKSRHIYHNFRSFKSSVYFENKIVENTENTIELSADLCNNG